MAKYTIELRNVCNYYTREEVESWFKNYDITNYLLPEQLQIVQTTPIWNKDTLAKQIVDHYYMREIGFETPYLFKHYAQITMNEIMGKYLPLIYTIALEYDPLINENYTETFNRNAIGNGENTGNSDSNSTSNAEGMTINNDTPQTNINRQDINTGVYANNVNQSDTNSNITNNTSTHSNTSQTTNEKYERTFKGNHGILATYQKLIQQYRENIISINQEIIKELNILFMGLY